VNVFIHGGAFEYGSNSAFAYSTHLYDGTNFTVQQNALMVTINYRLGALGWMAFPHDSGDPSRAVANFGLKDQTSALRWVSVTH
jgi:para-nitrobenzyl esterase